jgi:hypothetical protein
MTHLACSTQNRCSYKTSAFVPSIWSARLMSNMYAKQVLAPLTTREYEGELKGVGDVVKVLGVGHVHAGCYLLNKATAAITYCTVGGVTKSIEISNSDYFALRVEDLEQVQAKPAYVSELTKEAAIALAKRSDAFLYNVMHTAAVCTTVDCWGWMGGSSGCTGCGKGYMLAPPTKRSCTIASTSGGGWLWKCGCHTKVCSLYNNLVTLGAAMDDNLAPEEGRFIVIPPILYTLLLRDHRFVAAGAAGQVQAISKRAVGAVAGFEVIVLPKSGFTVWDSVTGAPSVGGNASAVLCTNLLYRAIAGVKGAIAYADKISKVENVRLESHFADGIRGLHIYGGGSLKPQWMYALGLTINIGSPT